MASSADESVIRNLIAKVEALTLIYAGQKKRLFHCKRDAGCIVELKGLTKKRLSLVHHDALEAVDLLNEQLVELECEACSRLSVSGSQSCSDMSESSIYITSDEQNRSAITKNASAQSDPIPARLRNLTSTANLVMQKS